MLLLPRRWLQTLLLLSLVLNPIAGSSMMLHRLGAGDSVSFPHIDITPDASSVDDHSCAPASTTDCCCPLMASMCGASALQPTPLRLFRRDGYGTWQNLPGSPWQSRVIDIEPRPPRRPL
jgi:hypothetical protein